MGDVSTSGRRCWSEKALEPTSGGKSTVARGASMAVLDWSFDVSVGPRGLHEGQSGNRLVSLYLTPSCR